MPSSVPPFFHVGSPPRPAGFGNVRDSGYRCSGSTPEVRRAASRSGGALRCCSCPFEPGSLVPLVWLTEAPSRFRPSDQSTQPLAAHCPLPSPAAHCPLLLLLPSCALPPTSSVAARLFFRNTTLGVLCPSSRGPYSLSYQGRAPLPVFRRLRGGGGCTSSTPSISKQTITRQQLHKSN